MKFKIAKNFICLLITAFLLVISCACSNGTTDAVYLVYYTNSGADDIIYREVSINRQNMSDTELAQALLDLMFYSDSLNDEQFYSVKPSELEILNLAITDNNVITIDFSSEYLEMSNVREIIFRAAVVLTLIQINDISGVEFRVEGEPITDSEGKNIGVMNAEQFVNVLLTEEGMLIQDTALTIYFADETGERLLPATYIFTIDNKNLSLEEYIVQAIIDGPTQDGFYKTVDPEVEIINVFTTDMICYVNLNSTFLSQNQTVGDDIMIYSIVDSLCSLSYVNAVQFLVEGESDVTLHMTFDLSLPIKKNLSFAEES